MKMYDNYVSKMKKARVVKNWVIKFRVIIISVLATIFALTTGFLSTKGLVVENVTLPTDIQFGQQIELGDSNALFSDYHYEYAKKGTNEWTTEIPSIPGEYEVRVVTKKSFGQVGYGKPVPFEIKPKEVDLNVLDEFVEYGQNPKLFEIALEAGHSLIEDELTFTYSTFSSEQSKVNAKLDSVKIVDENGKDVTSFYSVATPQKDITFKDKVIYIGVNAVTKEYDGQPFDYQATLTEDSYIDLFNDDQITSFDVIILDSKGNIVEGSPSELGYTALDNSRNDPYTLRVDASSVKIFNGEDETTMNYGINVVDSTMSITPRQISVSTLDASKIYDGTPLYVKHLEVE